MDLEYQIAIHNRYDELAKAIAEAWIWLEREGMLAPKPRQGRDWVYVTRRGKELLAHSDINKYIRSDLIPRKSLDPVLANKVYPLFIRGDYDTAVFQAFKEVEIRVREAASLPQDLFGVDLVRNAFNPENGKLTDMTSIKAEREAKSHLFAGALGLFKNPSSHRDVNWQDLGECNAKVSQFGGCDYHRGFSETVTRGAGATLLAELYRKAA